VPVTKLAVEIYDSSKNFEFVREILLLKKAHKEPWVKDSNSEEVLKKLMIFSNGSHLGMKFKNKIRFFSL
jgi:hypothetical protein